jgi:N-acetylmuramoyl-L-alanine amidase
MIVLLDNGHGNNTPGKRSPKWPNGTQLFEYDYARQIAIRVEKILASRGISVRRIVPELNDISLHERCTRVNAICNKVGNHNCILVSIHCNAEGNGEPEKARGWSVFVYDEAGSGSRRLANCFCDSALKANLKLRAYSAYQRYWKGNLAMCRDTHCPAVLTENLFMDNEQDCAFLLSEIGKDTIAQIHVDAILKYITT